jgi:hypothetical protein
MIVSPFAVLRFVVRVRLLLQVHLSTFPNRDVPLTTL